MTLNRQLYTNSLLLWYEEHPDHLQIVNCLNNSDKTDSELPSLRQIDYFVVNYAKQHKIVYYIDQKDPFEVNSEYKAQLKAFSKEYFDPFRRGNRFYIEEVETALCQLNFFRWAIPTGVLSYTMTNTLEIELEMNQKINERKNASEKFTKKRILNDPNPYMCMHHALPSTTTFIKPFEFYEPKP